MCFILSDFHKQKWSEKKHLVLVSKLRVDDVVTAQPRLF